MLLEFDISENGYEFAADIQTEIYMSEIELSEIAYQLEENLDILGKLTPECDKTDYILAVCSGVICGVMDIFLVGTPSRTTIGDITDRWFENRTMDFAKLCGWKNENENALPSAIRYLEKKFTIPYDQRGAGDAASWIFELNPKNHHFKSLGHNPTLLGLFFSIIDQFKDTSHFVSGGEIISLQEADEQFELRGSNVSSKLFCGFINWFGHLISDVSGASSSRGRGMGIPSPFWCWTNDIIAIKKKLNMPVLDFDKSVNEIALEIYKRGYDVRFQTVQMIPVFVNELIVRTLYSIRRLIRYYLTIQKEERNFSLLWKSCEPFSNATVKRMLTVAHGSFCLLDISDALARSFLSGPVNFNVIELFMRLNIIGVGRFGISLFGEVNRSLKSLSLREKVVTIRREKVIVTDYIEALKDLAEIYDDKDLLLFTNELKDSDLYTEAFAKSALLAEKRSVPKEQILRQKSDIDFYFKGGNE